MICSYFRLPRLRLPSFLSLRQENLESSSEVYRGIKLYAPVVHLHGAESVRQPNAVAVLFGGTVEVEDLILRFRRNPHAAIHNYNQNVIAGSLGSNIQRSPVRHGLAAVQHNV